MCDVHIVPFHRVHIRVVVVVQQIYLARRWRYFEIEGVRTYAAGEHCSKDGSSSPPDLT